MEFIEKFNKLVEELSKGLVGKEQVIKAGLFTLLSKENLILIGPPGTAKSEIARRLTLAIKDGKNYEYLLTKFTTPEEIFGPLSLTELKNDKFVRKTEGYLPNANIGFLDEIFKANSSILNSLLTIINEKVYHNGNVKQKTNIVSIVGASNELPTEEPELQALYDRFLIKKVVGYLNYNEIDKLYDINTKNKIEIKDELKFTLEDIDKINQESKKIEISSEVKMFLKNLKKEIELEFHNEPLERISDRKFVKLINLCRNSAYLHKREKVELSDCLIIIDCLWNKIEHQKKIYGIFQKEIKKYMENVNGENQ